MCEFSSNFEIKYSRQLPEFAAGDGGEDGLCGFRVEVAGEDDGRVATVAIAVGLGVVCEELDDVLALLVPEGGEEGAVARLQVRRRHAQPNSLGVGPGSQGRCEHHLQSEIVPVSLLDRKCSVKMMTRLRDLASWLPMAATKSFSIMRVM